MEPKGRRMRKTREPIERLELRVSIKADRRTAERIRELIPSARLRGRSCVLKVVGERPAEVAAEAEEMVEKLTGVLSAPKAFKNAEGSRVQK